MRGYVVPAIVAGVAVIAMANTKQPSNSQDTIPIYNAATGKVEQLKPVHKTDAEWKAQLTPEQYRITRLKGTEAPSATTCSIHPEGSGVYKCVCCGTDLFKFGTKFESGTGWPSFFEPISKLNVRLEEDDSHGMRRTEVMCARCGAHLGHVFEDGPPPTGKRYCTNSVALKPAEMKHEAKHETATFAAGCFWGVESAFRELLGKGVISTKVGYTGGHTKNPTYEDVCSHTTGHAEAVEVVYDPTKITYERLLKLFWDMHDPTTRNRQGPDIGSNYRSAIFYHTPEQHAAAEKSKEELEKSGHFKRPIVTEITQAGVFYLAEDYHQQYFEKRGMKPTCHLSSAD